MNHLRRILAALATLAGATLALALAAAPAALAVAAPPPMGGGGNVPPPPPPPVRVIAEGGMPGWQIALIALAAALIAATAAVLADRARAARKIHAPTA